MEIFKMSKNQDLMSEYFNTFTTPKSELLKMINFDHNDLNDLLKKAGEIPNIKSSEFLGINNDSDFIFKIELINENEIGRAHV